MGSSTSPRDASPLHPVLGGPGRWRCTSRVHELAAEGKTQADIIRRLHLHPHTVRKYLRMPTFVAHYCHPHPSPVKPYRAYLEARWQQGEVMITILWHELQEQGFCGSYKSVWAFVRNWPLPAGMTPASCSAVAAATRRGVVATRTPWQAKWLLLRPPEALSERDASYCQALYHLRPALEEAASLARRFVAMVRDHRGDQLDAWLDQASASPQQELRRFALGLRAEYAAARAALTESWSTGQVEGQITRLKYLKRQMYGRAHIDLLRLRVLHAA
jgi:transposase